MIRLTVRGEFSAAHRLRDYGGKCENLHGHNWKVEVEVEGESVGPDGMLLDFGVMRRELARVLETLDHRFLNEDVEVFRRENPTAENIARYIFEALKGVLSSERCRLAAVTVAETDRSVCRYEG